MATIIFDFDDTLFDTKRLKKTIFEKLSSFDISMDVIRESYRNSLRENQGNFIFKKKVLYLQKNHEAQISDDIFMWFKNLDFSSYVFKDSHDQLSKLSKNHTLILLTKGSRDFQEIKIDGSNLKKFFKEIHIAEGTKEDFLYKKNFTGEIYFINDKEAENEIVRNEFPNIKVFGVNKKKELIESLCS